MTMSFIRVGVKRQITVNIVDEERKMETA